MTVKDKIRLRAEELGLTKRWEAISLASLWESGVYGGLRQRRKHHLTGVGGHRGAARVKDTKRVVTVASNLERYACHSQVLLKTINMKNQSAFERVRGLTRPLTSDFPACRNRNVELCWSKATGQVGLIHTGGSH